MQFRTAATVEEILETTDQYQILNTELGQAIAYTEHVGLVQIGGKVLLNRTAKILKLGTGGYDFVIAVFDDTPDEVPVGDEHIVKLRYTPSQVAVNALESNPDNADIWDRSLQNTPVVVCQLHSQIAHCAAAAAAEGRRVVYVMTDSACLMASFSRLLRQLRSYNIIAATITVGQATQGDYETVTVHSALLAARHLLKAEVIIVGQGPGNAGTGTKYGFGGIEQASLLDIAASLGGAPIALVRASSADTRERHQGISHHTRTTLELVRSQCTIPVPEGMITAGLESRHRIVEVDCLWKSQNLLNERGIHVTTMGRSYLQDKDFFDAASAAGRYAALYEVD